MPGDDSTRRRWHHCRVYVNTDVLPFFEKLQATIATVLSDIGMEFCGWPHQHPCELFLQLEGIEHLRRA